MESSSDKPLISKGGAAFDVILTILFFIFMAGVCANHAPAETESVRNIIGAFCAVPLAGTFWVACSLFRVTLVDQVRRGNNVP